MPAKGWRKPQSKKAVTIRLYDEQKLKIEEMAKYEDVSFACIIETALEEYIKNHKYVFKGSKLLGTKAELKQKTSEEVQSNQQKKKKGMCE